MPQLDRDWPSQHASHRRLDATDEGGARPDLDIYSVSGEEQGDGEGGWMAAEHQVRDYVGSHYGATLLHTPKDHVHQYGPRVMDECAAVAGRWSREISGYV